MSVFLMAGGGTGGHVIPGLAVARELQRRGHEPVFAGTRHGYEAALVPAQGFAIDFIEIGGLNRVGVAQTLKTLLLLPPSVFAALNILKRRRPAALFSMGGYAAGPLMMAGQLRRLPMIVMEPNAMPGVTSRMFAKWVKRALVSFPESERYFPAGRTEITGLPVRPEFFALPAKPREDVLTILVTGGSRGSRTLNNACRAAWPLFQKAPFRVRLIHQAGKDAWRAVADEFAATGLDGEVTAFIDDMPAAFGRADVIVSRSGAGAVAELAAAGKPAILVPFPFAADDHQYHNAKALTDGGAARLVRDAELTGERLYKEISELAAQPDTLPHMAAAARHFARPGAAERAADLLEQLSFSVKA
ncbi:MAG: undecaprenyldiphospho-muramoylpentapeptide beta-N-acetylglucosaminyltransferase [Bryobacteraceae bacterium]